MAYWEGGVCAKPGGHAGTTKCSLSVTTSNVWNNYGIQAAMVGYSWADIVDAWGFDIIVGNYAASNNPGGAGATSTKSHPRWNKTAKKPDGGQRNSPNFPRRWGWDYTITCYTQYRDLNPTVYQGIVKGTITIPKIAAPQHSIKAVSNKTAVCYGEQVTLTLTDVPGAANNAWMWNFLITTGGKTIKTGDRNNTAGRSESFTFTPSDYTGREGGYLDVVCHCRHEWYGTYPEATTTIRLYVCPTIVVYDATGAPKTGIVTAYDSSGSPRNAAIYTYRADGSLSASS